MELPLPLTLLNWLAFALLAAVAALTALGFRPAVAFIKAHINARLYEILRKWAYTYVAALAQDPTLKGLASEEKKQQAVIWLVIKAKELGISLTEREASQIIEEAVYLVKKVMLPTAEDILKLTAVG
jgi:hypothetical protein